MLNAIGDATTAPRPILSSAPNASLASTWFLTAVPPTAGPALLPANAWTALIPIPPCASAASLDSPSTPQPTPAHSAASLALPALVVQSLPAQHVFKDGSTSPPTIPAC